MERKFEVIFQINHYNFLPSQANFLPLPQLS
jgi:hypothetical protein